MQRIYLDHNSTTPMLGEVAAAMADCIANGYANPASQHQAGRRARQMLEDARETIGRILGAEVGGRQPDRVILTSGGTEANNLAILGLAAGALLGEARDKPLGEIVTSAIEHPSLLGPVEHLERQGWCVKRIGASRDGVIDIDAFQAAISERTRLASVMLGNNETGVLQPIGELAALCRAAGVTLHTDAVQAVGQIPIDFRRLGVAAMTVAAHKFHGPLGIGALLLRADVPIGPMLFGGFQQEALRPGTEPVALAVGMAEALRIWERESDHRARRMAELRDHFEAGLRAGFLTASGLTADGPPVSPVACPAAGPFAFRSDKPTAGPVNGLVINGADAARLPHTSNVSFVGLDRQQLLMALDLAGIDCATGSACASGSSEPSPVLVAMGCPRDVVHSALRFSLGATTTEAEIDEAVRRIVEVCTRLTGKPALARHSR